MRAGLRRHIITKLLVKESEGPGEHPGLGIYAKVLEELKVTSKPAKVKLKPGKRMQEVAVAVFWRMEVLKAVSLP